MLKRSNLFLLIILFFFVSCAPNLAPAVYFENSSKNGEVVKNIKVNWSGSWLLGIRKLGVCGNASESHNAKNIKYGLVQISWENAKEEKLTKSIEFTKNDMPNYSKWRSNLGKYIVLYFDQENVELYTSDSPDIQEVKKEKKGGWVLMRGKCVRIP